jgi:hypothetical protein
MKSILKFFTDYIGSTIFIVIYFAWWIFVLYWFTFVNGKFQNSGGMENGAIIMYSFFIAAFYSLIFSFLALINFKRKRKNFLIFLGIVLFPILLIFLYLFIFAIRK